jgi:hypothetical protein
MRSQYQVAYLFSTKYQVSPWIRSERWEQLNRRFFGAHQDVSPELAAEFLHGKIVFLARSKAEWVAVLEMEQPSSVASATGADHQPQAAYAFEEGPPRSAGSRLPSVMKGP